MNSGDGTLGWVGEQDRNAVGSLNANGNARRIFNQGIAGFAPGRPSMIHDDARRMDLMKRNDVGWWNGVSCPKLVVDEIQGIEGHEKGH